MTPFENLLSAYKNRELSTQEYFFRMQAMHSYLHSYAEFLSKTGIQGIDITDGRVFLTSRPYGVKFACDPRDMGSPPIVAFNLGSYEVVELNIVSQLMENGMVFFDIGANVGWYGLHIAKLFPDSKIFAFEPVKAIHQFLQESIQANAFQNVKAFSFGLSSAAGTRKFHFDQFASGATSSAIGISSGREIDCEVRSLDEVVSELGVHVDFIKADVEGAEMFVFEGGMNCIKNDKPIIFSEMLRKHAANFQYHPNDIISMLRAEGYDCFTFKGRHLVRFFEMDVNTIETNFIFLHAQKHAEKIEVMTQ